MRAALALSLVLAGCITDGSVGPEPPPNAIQFGSIAAGYYHTCGLSLTGRAYCWGMNGFGTLGDGTRTTRTAPTPVVGTLSFTGLDAGAGHNCASTPNGVAVCWGQNDEGQVGDGSFTARDEPVPVAGGLSFRTVSAGHAHSCGITTNGAAYCWGDNSRGQLGAGSEAPGKSAVPLRVQFAGTFREVIAGYYQTCALTQTAEAYCWGLNSSGQNGDNSTTDRYAPVRAQATATFSSISPGDRFVCGISSGRSLCWGANRHGESRSDEPLTEVFASSGESTIQSAQSYACGLLVTSQGICWGGSIRGLRRAGAELLPLHTKLAFRHIAAGAEHVCALSIDGYAYCAGANYDGQLGDGTQTDRSSLVAVTGPVTP